jgi:hypothetical protein
MRLKSDVRLHGIRPEVVFALIVSEQVYRDYGTELVVTSVIDGQHTPGSLHYAGCAADLRTRDLPEGKAPHVRFQIAERLGADFDVALEATHIHLEFQPKKPY